LIVQGGTDANNNISMLVKRLSKKKLNFEAKFFVKTNNSEDMKKIKLLKNVYVIGKVKNIISVLKKINLAISACGGFAYELGYFGIPTIHVSSEKREIIRAKLLKKKNLGEFFYPKNINQIFNEINKIYYEKTYREMLIKNRINFFKKKNKFLNLLLKI
jgi:spore coat polysaccharide biosynthesis predicted glycosyltransferase SpsG